MQGRAARAFRGVVLRAKGFGRRPPKPTGSRARQGARATFGAPRRVLLNAAEGLRTQAWRPERGEHSRPKPMCVRQVTLAPWSFADWAGDEAAKKRLVSARAQFQGCVGTAKHAHCGFDRPAAHFADDDGRLGANGSFGSQPEQAGSRVGAPAVRNCHLILRRERIACSLDSLVVRSSSSDVWIWYRSVHSCDQRLAPILARPTQLTCFGVQWNADWMRKVDL